MGNDITHARIGLRMHEFNLHAQARSCIRRKPNQHKKQSRNLKRTI